MALEGQAPAQRVGIGVEGGNKRLALLRNAYRREPDTGHHA